MNTAAIILSRQRGWRFQRQVRAELPAQVQQAAQVRCPPAAGAAGASGSADTGSQASGPEHQLTVSVERGLKEQAASAAGELLKTMDSLDRHQLLHDPGTR